MKHIELANRTAHEGLLTGITSNTRRSTGILKVIRISAWPEMLESRLLYTEREKGENKFSSGLLRLMITKKVLCMHILGTAYIYFIISRVRARTACGPTRVIVRTITIPHSAMSNQFSAMNSKVQITLLCKCGSMEFKVFLLILDTFWGWFLGILA